MGKNPKISVIIPAYNAELTIGRCLESILSQEFVEIEVIIVNDGSKDGTMKICSKYAESDNRIIVHEIPNSGVSIARNKGIKLAKGKYITFVDADDYIEFGCLEKIFQAAETDDADLMVWNYHFVRDTLGKKNSDFPEEMVTRKATDISYARATTLCPLITNLNSPTGRIVVMGFACSKLFKTSIIRDNNILFPEGVILYEDVAFVYKYLEHVATLKFIQNPYYYYVESENGATLRYKPEIVDSNHAFINHLRTYLPSMNEVELQAYYCRVFRCLSNVAKYYCFHKNFKGRKINAFLEIAKRDEHYMEAIQNVKFAYLTTKQKALLFCIKMALWMGKCD